MRDSCSVDAATLPNPVVVSGLVSLVVVFSVDEVARIGGIAPTERRCRPGALRGCVRGLGGSLGLGGVGLGLLCLLFAVRPLRRVPSGDGSNRGGLMLSLLGFFFSPPVVVSRVLGDADNNSVFSVSLDLARWNLASSL